MIQYYYDNINFVSKYTAEEQLEILKDVFAGIAKPQPQVKVIRFQNGIEVFERPAIFPPANQKYIKKFIRCFRYPELFI